MATGTSGTPASRSPSTIAAGSLNGRSSSSEAFRCVIHTAPSRVARQIAPWRWAITAPGVPRSSPSGCASYRCTGRSRMRSATPGTPSAQRILRSTVALSSRCQSIARSGCFISGRGRPRTSGLP